MHPELAKLAAASQTYVAGFRPLSIPDLRRHLNSQATYLRIVGDHAYALSDRLASAFPGAAAAHSYFHAVGQGFAHMAPTARMLYEAWAAFHKADLARHEQPRVNEHLADIARHAWGGQVPPLPDGSSMHEYHAIMLAVTRDSIAGYFPGGTEEDAVRDLMWYIGSLPEVMYHLHTDMKTYADHLVTQYPVDHGVHAFYLSLADGYLDLTHRGKQLADGYATVNAHDVMRRNQPRVNEAWADAGNKAMT